MGDASESAYILERDQDETKRLNSQQEFFYNLLNNDLIHPSIPRDSLSTIADVATGTGMWVTSLPVYLSSVDDKSDHPHSRTLHGIDISADQFPFTEKDIGPNYKLQFLVHDMRNRFLESYHGKYDLVNVSHLIAALREEEYEAAVRNLYEILKPNGYLQWTECTSLNFSSIQLPNLEIKVIPELEKLVGDMVSHVGFTPNPPLKIEQLEHEIGFAQVDNYVYASVERADLRAQGRKWQPTVWRAVVPPAMLGSGRAGSMQEAKEKTGELIEQIERRYGVFWPNMDLHVLVASKGD